MLNEYDRYGAYSKADAYDIIDYILNDDYSFQTWVHSRTHRWVFLDGENTGLKVLAFTKGSNFYLPFMIGKHTIEIVYDPDVDTNQINDYTSRGWI